MKHVRWKRRIRLFVSVQNWEYDDFLLMLLWLVFFCVKLLLNGRTSLHVPHRIVILCIWLFGPNEWRAQAMIHMVANSPSLDIVIESIHINSIEWVSLFHCHCERFLIKFAVVHSHCFCGHECSWVCFDEIRGKRIQQQKNIQLPLMKINTFWIQFGIPSFLHCGTKDLKCKPSKW